MSYQAARHEGSDAGANHPILFTFHGTGGDEHQFHAMAQEMLPHARIVSPRGDVSENGANRYFRRKAEGVYDMDDLRERTATMARFMAAEARGRAPVIAMGYSNGANILASVMLHAPELIDAAVLLHPLIPWQPDPCPELAGKRILITAGRLDPICPKEKTQALARYLSDQQADVTTVWHDGGHEIAPREVEALVPFIVDAAQPR
jgi:phospholipase/carboxylesterase